MFLLLKTDLLMGILLSNYEAKKVSIPIIYEDHFLAYQITDTDWKFFISNIALCKALQLKYSKVHIVKNVYRII